MSHGVLTLYTYGARDRIVEDLPSEKWGGYVKKVALGADTLNEIKGVDSDYAILNKSIVIGAGEPFVSASTVDRRVREMFGGDDSSNENNDDSSNDDSSNDDNEIDNEIDIDMINDNISGDVEIPKLETNANFNPSGSENAPAMRMSEGGDEVLFVCPFLPTPTKSILEESEEDEGKSDYALAMSVDVASSETINGAYDTVLGSALEDETDDELVGVRRKSSQKNILHAEDNISDYNTMYVL